MFKSKNQEGNNSMKRKRRADKTDEGPEYRRACTWTAAYRQVVILFCTTFWSPIRGHVPHAQIYTVYAYTL